MLEKARIGGSTYVWKKERVERIKSRRIELSNFRRGIFDKREEPVEQPKPRRSFHFKPENEASV